MDEYRSAAIEVQDAMEMLGKWKSEKREIGVIFWGRAANVYTVGTLKSITARRIEIQGQGARATFSLAGASFRFGPMHTWPQWPSPPIVMLSALRAEFESGEYLALAEGLTPTPTVGAPALPE
jgi:hypothetical protein